MKNEKRTNQSTAMSRPHNYVPALYERGEQPGPSLGRPIQLAPRHEVAHIIDVPMNATQHSEAKRSAVDRALGFVIASGR